ncbi:MAG: LysE family transporter [Thermoproteota archaeon]
MNSIVEIPLTSFIVSLSGALAPGPLMITTVRESSYMRSFKPGLFLSFGHALAEAPVTVMLTYGLLNISEDFYPIISIFGGIFLASMGILSFLKKARSIEAREVARAHRSLTMVALGATISVSNPYWTTWWLTVGATYVSKSLPWGVLGIVLFYISHQLGDFAVLGSISKLMATGARSIGEKRLKILIIVCNIAMIAIGISFILEGTRVFKS